MSAGAVGQRTLCAQQERFERRPGLPGAICIVADVRVETPWMSSVVDLVNHVRRRCARAHPTPAGALP
jgi:hypothetical protein